MSIERLNKAATAAGFAMATPDDDATVDVRAPEPTDEPASRALVLTSSASQRPSSAQSQSRLSDWVRGYLPGMGWRAPA